MGTAEVESALVSHKDIAEAAVVALSHDIKANAIHAFAILNEGVGESPDLATAIKQHVRHELGPIVVPEEINFVISVSKTRSGKIVHRVLKVQALGEDSGDLSTTED